MKRWRKNLRRAMGRLVMSSAAIAFALLLTGLAFLVLPLLEQVGQRKKNDLEIRQVDIASLEPPPPPAIEEEEPEPEEEPPPPPDLSDEAPPLDLSQLELALNPGFGDGMGGDFAIKLPGAQGRSDASQASDDIFSAADLDQAPRPIQQPPPEYPPSLKSKKLRGTVYIMFIVDKLGRVKKPMIKKSTHGAFEDPALRAVRRWRFEPGKRKGQVVETKMMVPITFLPG